MKRLLLSLAGLSLISGFATAQMSDVPQTHWAYDAIEELVRMGIIQGYPDGTFKPRRTMTRAEFAEAMAKAYRSLDEKIRAMNGRIDELQRQIGNIRPGDGGAGAPDLTDRVQKLEGAVQELNRLNEAVATLNRLAQTFQQELASQGVDVNSLKQRVADLDARLKALEGSKDKVKLSGDVTFGAFGTHSFDGKSAITQRGQFIHPSGKILESTEVLHELGLGVDVAVSDDVMGKGTFIISNYLPYLGMANRAAFSTAPGPALTPSNTSITIWEAYVKAPIDLFGNQVQLSVGRLPVRGSRYTLHSIDPDNYLGFARYDDGMFRVDGATLSFDFGTVKLGLGAGRTRTVADSNGLNFSNLMFGNHKTTGPAADQVAGARLTIDAIRSGDEEGGNSLTVGATYYAAGVPNTTAPAPTTGTYNRVDVLGVDLNAVFAGFKVYAEYAQSQLYNDDTSILNKENWALDANLGYDIANNLNLMVGYREIRPRFMAPGSWGRIGYYYNPSDIKGFYAKASYHMSEDLGIMVGGAFYEGTGRLSTANGGYQTNDKVNVLLAGIDYKLSERWNVSFNYEGVFWRPRSATFDSPTVSPVWNYFTLGVGYNMGENTTLNVMYQVLDYDGKGVAALSGGPSSGKNRGGVAATTLSVKF